MTHNNVRWIVGSNTPGYMPDSEPFEAESWDHAKDCCMSDIERDCDDVYEPTPELDADYQEAINALSSLEPGQEFGWTVNNRHYWITKA